MKKKKIVYISIITVLFIIVLFSIGICFFISNNNKIKNIKKEPGLQNNTIKQESTVINSDLVKSKLELIKNRLKIKDIISRGDNYFQNEQLGLAVIQYKIALAKTPDDYRITEKIGDIYFEMKNFPEAINYYKKLNNNVGFDTSKYILSLLYSRDLLNKQNREYIKNEIENNITDKEKVYFYTNVVYCVEDFHLCKRNYDDKILLEKDTLKSKELTEIKDTLKTYTDFGLVNLYYKDSLIIGSFMKLKLYPISIILGKQLLTEKQDYKAILQIISQSYFEVGDYKNAYLYLKSYFEQTPTDSNAAYMLGIVNLKLDDYILSNIFLNKALYLGYKDTLNIKRKIAYNYYMLNEFDKMYNEFDEIINTEKNITKDDVNIMINYSIENNKNEKTYEWTKKSLLLFPNEPLFYAYMGKQELDKGQNVLASLYLNRGLKIEPNNQLINYIFGLLKIKENNKDDAKEYLEKAYNTNRKSTLAKEIQKELDNL